MRIRFLAKRQAIPLQDMDDLELVARYRNQGDMQCIAILMDRYAGQIVAFGIKQLDNQEDVRDFANDVYLKLTEKLKTNEPQNFKSWLYVFMRNLCYDKGRRQQLAEQFVVSQKAAGTDVVEEEIDKTLDHKLLHQAIDELPNRESEVIRLIYLEEKNYLEAMEATGLTFNQLRGIRNRGMARLKVSLQKRMGR